MIICWGTATGIGKQLPISNKNTIHKEYMIWRISLISFQMYYLFLHEQELLVIFEGFV